MILLLATLAFADPADGYHVGAGDVLSVQIFGEKELSGSYTVSDAGAIDFPLVGSVAVLGASPAEITTRLREKLVPGYLVSPSITVSVATYRSQPVQVLGGVAHPGVYYLRGPTTVIQLLSDAGGVNREGVDEVRIVHAGAADTVIPYGQLLAGGGAVELAAGDTVVVPQSLVTVSGQVKNPGDFPFRDGLTLSAAVAVAGGALPTARLKSVTIVRGDQTLQVDLRKILQGKAEDPKLAPGDKIFLSESPV